MENHFYESLNTHHGPVGELFAQDQLFSPLPLDWEIVITDIQGSSIAVSEGLHKVINLIATGSIVCVLNIAQQHKIVIPFFFGGDGATFLLPQSLVAEVLENLSVYQAQIQKNFGLWLRVGHVSAAETYAVGQKIHIAKYSYSDKFNIPLVIGNGLNYAERLIKQAEAMPLVKDPGRTELDLTGMHCRWDMIPPPMDKDEIVTLLVSATNVNRQGPAFRKVLNELDKIYGYLPKRQPISESKLKVNSTLKDIGMEILVRGGRYKWYELLKEWLSVVYSYLYFRTRSGKTYLKTLVEMSDTLVVDGKINTVITGNEEQRNQLISFLTNLESDGEIFYGVHVSRASVMSCYVPDLMDGHIHFVDGSGGGYTQAARMLKAKLS